MKNNTQILVLLMCFLCSSFVFAQENNTSKFNIITLGGIGYGKVKNDKEPTYNLNSNSGEILVNYNFSDHFGLATGFGYNELSGNGFNTLGQFYHERSLKKIPLLFTLKGDLSEKLEFFANFGLYAQTIVKDKYQYLSEIRENEYDGWNFGTQFGIGVLFPFMDHMKFGFSFQGQSDFSNFKSKTSADIKDKQKMIEFNTIGLILKFEL